MTARLLPSSRARHVVPAVSDLERAAYPVIDDLFRVVDCLTKTADPAITVEDADAALAKFSRDLIGFLVLASAARTKKANDEQAADWIAALAWAGA